MMLNNFLIVLFLVGLTVVIILVAPEVNAAIERTLDLTRAP